MTKPICPMCDGTGNAGHTAIAADGDPTGCLRCGGAGVLDWRNTVLRLTILVVFLVLLGALLTTGCGAELPTTPTKATTATGVAHITFTSTNSQAEVVTLSLEHMPLVNPAGPSIDILFSQDVDGVKVDEDGSSFPTRTDSYADDSTGRGGMRYWRVSVHFGHTYRIFVAYKGIWFTLPDVAVGAANPCGGCRDDGPVALPPVAVTAPVPATCSRDALDVAWLDPATVHDEETVTVGVRPGYTGSVLGYMVSYGVGQDGGATVIHRTPITMPGRESIHLTHGLYPGWRVVLACDPDGVTVLSSAAGK